MDAFFDFEKPIVDIENKLQELREIARQEGVDFSHEISILENKVSKLIDETYANLTPWQKVQVSRHPNRPYSRDYIEVLFPDFLELHGDRAFGDDQAIISGIATWPPVDPNADPSAPRKEECSVMIIGQQKGRTTKQKMERNFGMARPEGYRKSMRLMRLAEQSRMPIVTFIDTPGAYPGPDAEERGQAQAIAESIKMMFGLKVPVLALIIGEGGSGGALALGVANRILMLQYSTYSVISPESCASILWSDSSLAERASERLKMSPTDLHRFGVIDAIVEEPKGGAHRNLRAASKMIRAALLEHFQPLVQQHLNGEKTDLSNDRHNKFRIMGNFALAHTPEGSADSTPEVNT